MPAPPHDVSGHTWHHTDEQLVQITKKGASRILHGYESDMPGFEAVLSDRDIAAVLAYINITWPAEIRAQHPARRDRARTYLTIVVSLAQFGRGRCTCSFLGSGPP